MKSISFIKSLQNAKSEKIINQKIFKLTKGNIRIKPNKAQSMRRELRDVNFLEKRFLQKMKMKPKLMKRLGKAVLSIPKSKVKTKNCLSMLKKVKLSKKVSKNMVNKMLRTIQTKNFKAIELIDSKNFEVSECVDLNSILISEPRFIAEHDISLIGIFKTVGLSSRRILVNAKDSLLKSLKTFLRCREINDNFDLGNSIKNSLMFVQKYLSDNEYQKAYNTGVVAMICLIHNQNVNSYWF